jgi:hypothetical protein
MGREIGMDVIEYALYAYLVVGFAKSMLVLADVHVAAATAHRVNGRPLPLLMLGFIVGVLLKCFLMWPEVLMAEGWRFFLAYTRFAVMRDILKVFRDLGNQAAEKRV